MPKAFLALASSAVVGLLTLFAANLAASQTAVMKVGGPTINDTTHNWMKIVERRVEARSNGRIDVQLYPASQLGAIPRMIEGTQLGTIEVSIMPPDFLAGVDPRYSLPAAPGIFTDVSHGYRTMHDLAFKQLFWGLGDQKNLWTIGMTCDTPTTYVFRRPVTTLANFKGKKIRIFASPMERETMRRLGGTGVPMPLSEVLPGLDRGIVDGAKGTVTVFLPFKYYDLAKHITRTDEGLICVIKNASRMWMEKLPSDLRTIVAEEAVAADEENMPFILEFLDKSYAAWRANGGEIHDLPAAERHALMADLSRVGDAVVADNERMKEAYELMKAAATRTRR